MSVTSFLKGHKTMVGEYEQIRANILRTLYDFRKAGKHLCAISEIAEKLKHDAEEIADQIEILELESYVQVNKTLGGGRIVTLSASGVQRVLESKESPEPSIQPGRAIPMGQEIEPYHVFLSYSRKDTETMCRVRDDLRTEGLGVWTDENLAIGTQQWKDAIEDAIENAGCLVVILSPDAKQSVWVDRELEYARSQQVSIFSVLARGDSGNAIPIELVSDQWADIRIDYARGFQELLESVCRHLGVEGLSAQRERLAQEEARRQQAQVAVDKSRPPCKGGGTHPSDRGAIPEPKGEMLTNILRLHFQQVTIVADLNYSTVTQQAYNNIKSTVPTWVPDQSIWPGLAPTDVIEAFKRRNRERLKDEARGMLQETAHTPLVRLIACPILSSNTLHLVVAPISWDMFAVTIAYPTAERSDLHGKYIPDESLLRAVKKYMGKLPEVHPIDSGSPKCTVGPRYPVPLGLEALVVTSDNYALLRYRDLTSALGGQEWDVSFSGYARFDVKYCVDPPKDEDVPYVSLNLNRWVAKEFGREIGIEPGNLEDSYILGLHRRIDYDAIDILAFCRVKCDSETIAEALYIKPQLSREEGYNLARGIRWSVEDREKRRRELLEEFKSSRHLSGSPGALEREVLGTQNWFVKFTSADMGDFIARRVKPEDILMPEAKQLICEALKAECGT